MEQLLQQLEQLRAGRSLNQIAFEAQTSRHTVVNLFRGQGTLSSLHRLADALDHVVTLNVEGTDIEGLSLGDQLKMVRVDSGLSIKDAAAAAGITELTAARIEAGTDCLVRVISRYAAALGVSLVLLSADEIELRFARRDLDEWLDNAVLPLHALAGIVDLPIDAINAALLRRIDCIEHRIVFGS